MRTDSKVIDLGPARSSFDKPEKPENEDRARVQVRKAVVYALVHRPFSTLARGLAPSEWRIKGFRAKFYRQYDAKSEAVDDILRSSISPNRSQLTDALTAQMAELGRARTGDEPAPKLSEVITGLGEAYFSQCEGDDVLSLQMLAWVAAREQSSLREDFVTLYDSLDNRSVAGLSQLLEAWGRTPIDPFTWSDVATTFTALTEGLLIRRAVDEHGVDMKLFGQVAVAVVAGMTRHSADHTTHVSDKVDL